MANLTLSIDAGVLKAARRAAIERDTTVNELVRNYLKEVAEQTELKARREIARKELMELCRNSPMKVGKITWKREDLYDSKF